MFRMKCCKLKERLPVTASGVCWKHRSWCLERGFIRYSIMAPPFGKSQKCNGIWYMMRGECWPWVFYYSGLVMSSMVDSGHRWQSYWVSLASWLSAVEVKICCSFEGYTEGRGFRQCRCGCSKGKVAGNLLPSLLAAFLLTV